MIVVCGEALIDLFVGRPQANGIATEAVAGGSPYNVALGLARLGRKAAFLSTLADDAFGDFLLLRLQVAGVDTGLIRRVASSTTVSVVSTSTGGQPHYTFLATGADRALTAADLPDLPDTVRAIAVGSYALAVEPIGGAIAALLRRETGRRVISLDPNIRPRVIGDVAGFRPRWESLVAMATLVKASVEDLELFYGGADFAALAQAWLAKGPSLVVITRGLEGATAYFRGGSLARPGLRIEVLDTVGAGDTFHAALLANLDERGLLTLDCLAQLTADEVAPALEAAVAASALTCTRRGADLPTRADLDQFMQGLRA